MDETQAAMYWLVKWLFDHLWSTDIGKFAIPFVTLVMILKFVNWSRATAKGESAEEKRSDDESIQQRARAIGTSEPPARRSSYRRRS